MAKKTLKDILHDELRRKGYISFNRMEEICKDNHYKTETGRRVLEKDNSPQVEHLKAKSKRGSIFIKGYKWNDSFPQRSELKKDRPKFLYEMEESERGKYLGW